MTERRATPSRPLANILDRLLEQAMRNEQPSFRDLAKAAALDPARDFVGASLCDLDFRDEDLRGFDFSYADLSGADFRRANVEGVRFKGAKLDGAIGLPDKVGTTAWIIIVASSDADQLEMLEYGAQKIAEAIEGSRRPSVRIATSVEEVRKHRSAAVGRDQLLIVTAELPSRDVSTNPKVLPGLELIKSIAHEPKAPACILVSQDLAHFRIVQPIERCELLLVNATTDYIDDSLQLARRLKVVASAETATARGGPSPGTGVTLRLKSELDMVRARVGILTPRERQVFELVVRGRTNKQVGNALGCTERTVKAHRHRMMEKMQVKSLTELVSLAERVGDIVSVTGHRTGQDVERSEPRFGGRR